MLKGIFITYERTRSSIVASTAHMLRDFMIQENLLKMLSRSTFDVEKMYEEKTCVFLIIPDETSAYDKIAGLLIDIFYNRLIDVYTNRYQNKPDKKPRRVNFVCDEFCNLRINDMRAKISASRGREMRWYLVCQSKKQLEIAYQDAAATILGNCKNTVFLQSNDAEMLEHISVICGNTSVTDKGYPERLVSIERLKSLKKERAFKEALYIRDDLKFRAVLPDIDQYGFLRQYEGLTVSEDSRKKSHPAVEAYTPAMMLKDLSEAVIPVPFSVTPPTADARKVFEEIREEVLRKKLRKIEIEKAKAARDTAMFAEE
jgi:type IV secretion system protein VirD4